MAHAQIQTPRVTAHRLTQSLVVYHVDARYLYLDQFEEASREDIATILEYLIEALAVGTAMHEVRVYSFKNATLIIVADPHDFGVDYHMLVFEHEMNFVGYRRTTIE